MPKALVPLGPAAEPLVVHALRGVLACREVSDVVVVAPPDPDGLARLTAALSTTPTTTTLSPTGRSVVPDRTVGRARPDGRSCHVQVVPGGAERAGSVARGLAALPGEVGVVLVHDAARALTPVEVFDRVVQAVRTGHAAVTPALPVVDTIKQVRLGGAGEELVVGTVDRAALRAVQTPQGFLRETLERAHAEIEHAVTDDCGMVEALGGRVVVVPGSPRALKITTPHDLEVAAAWLDEPLGGRDAGSGQRVARPTVRSGTTDRPVWHDGPSGRWGEGAALVVLAGVPGVGKTTIARALCQRLGAAHLRVDTLEQGLVRGGLAEEDLGGQGYGAAYAVAADQLAVGLAVVADMVNPVAVVREAWGEVAATAGVPCLRVQVECSDAAVHRDRVEGRAADIDGHRLPTWAEVIERDVEPWPEADLRVDTATATVERAVEEIMSALTRTAGQSQEPR